MMQTSIGANDGNLLLAPAAPLRSDLEISGANSDIDIADPVEGHLALFAVNDLMRIHALGFRPLDEGAGVQPAHEFWRVGDIRAAEVCDVWLRVTAVSDEGTHFRYTASLQEGPLCTFAAGTLVVNYGAAGESRLLLQGDGDNAPYIDIFRNGATPWDEVTPLARFGQLALIASGQTGLAAGADLDNPNSRYLIASDRQLLLNRIDLRAREGGDETVRLSAGGELQLGSNIGDAAGIGLHFNPADNRFIVNAASTFTAATNFSAASRFEAGANFDGAANFSNSADFAGPVKFNGASEFANTAKFGAAADFTAATTFGANATFTNTTAFEGASTFAAATAFNGAADFGAATTFREAANFSAAAAFSAPTEFNAAAQFNNRAEFNGATTFTDQVNFGGALELTGPFSLSSNAIFSGALSALGAISAQGAITAQGAILSEDSITARGALNAQGPLTAQGPIEIVRDGMSRARLSGDGALLLGQNVDADNGVVFSVDPNRSRTDVYSRLIVHREAEFSRDLQIGGASNLLIGDHDNLRIGAGGIQMRLLPDNNNAVTVLGIGRAARLNAYQTTDDSQNVDLFGYYSDQGPSLTGRLTLGVANAANMADRDPDLYIRLDRSPTGQRTIEFNASSLIVRSTLTQFRSRVNVRGNFEFTGLGNSSRVFRLTNLPTRSNGLPSGAVWNDRGTLKIVA